MIEKIVQLSAPAPYCIGENETTYRAKAVIECHNDADYEDKLRFARMRFAIDNKVDLDNVKVTVISNG